jgi:two-component system, NtrC family, sensor kinase
MPLGMGKIGLSEMTALPPDVVTDLSRLIAELEQRLESSFAAHDEAIAQRAATARENARLRDELATAREREAAAAAILEVIASSPSDVQPVFDAVVQTAVRLLRCDVVAVLRRDGFTFSPAAEATPEGLTANITAQNVPIDPDANFPSRAIIEKKMLHLPDYSRIDLPEHERRIQAIIGVHSALFLPLLREDECIGVLALTGKRPRTFGESEIALAESFRDQALIAIENTRLFNESREALERQTATAGILEVIASSPSDVQPIFDAIVNSAAKLFGPCGATITTLKNGELHWNATGTTLPGFEVERAKAVYPIPFDPDLAPSARAVLERRIIEIPDIMAPDTPEFTRQAAAAGGFQSITFVPLVNQNKGIGTIILTHPQAGFRLSEKQLALVQTFADQAVIAIENARLFDEVQARTRELAASLDELRTAQDRLVQTEKLASLGQLTAGISHEIKNPLNFVNNFAALSAELTGELNDVLKPAALSDEIRGEVDELTGLLRDNLEKVVQHGKRADSIVKNMLLHSRAGSGDHRPADINALLDESLNLAYHGARAEKPQFNVTLQRHFDPAAGMIEMFPQEITRVFLNLVSNGFYAMAKRKIEVGDSGFDPVLSATTRNLGDTVEIRIRDNGIGIPPEVRDKMFNPFFTTKPAGEGTGLGLSISHDIIVKQHGGALDVDTEPGQFTEFRIVLPKTGHHPNKDRG